MKLYIRAMATADRRVKDELISNSKPMIKHLLKVIFYPDSECVKGWIKEIYSFISDVDKLKRTKKFPSEKFIYDCISSHNDILDNLSVVVKSSMRDSGLIPNEYTQTELLDMIDGYLRWLSRELSIHGQVDYSDVINAVKLYCKVR